MKTFKILDCTVRDGGYINNWGFSREFVAEMYQASAEAGTDIFEIGFLSNDTTLPLWRQSPPSEVLAIRKGRKTAISAMLEANTVGIKLGAPAETGIDILRIALNRDKIEASLPKMAEYRHQGYKVFVQLMGITGYTDMQILQAVEILTKSTYVDVISIGDSYGSLIPNRTRDIVSLIAKNTSLEVGLHAHNNMLLGMANVLEAVNAGATYIDASMYGMGRGGGNVPLELVLSYFAKKYPERYDVSPVLEFVDQKMSQLKREYSWGYSVAALLSGVYECHPYYTSKLVETREFTISQVLKATQKISNMDVIGFSQNVLAEIVGSPDFLFAGNDEQSLHKFIEKNIHTATYAQRHAGRDFLILGNGPSLVENKSEIEEFIKQKDPIILGANNLDKMFVPHYHAFTNQRRYEQFHHTCSPESELLLGPNISVRGEQKYDRIVCYDSALTPLKIMRDVITSNCRSVSVLLGAVAIVMGAKSIYFAGLDGYLDGKTLFYCEDENTDYRYLQEKHNSNEKYLFELKQLAENNCGIRIKSITPSTYHALKEF